MITDTIILIGRYKINTIKKFTEDGKVVKRYCTSWWWCGSGSINIKSSFKLIK